MRVEDYHAGDRLTATELNEIRAEIRRLGLISTVPPLNHANDSGGIGIWFDGLKAFAIKLTGGGTGGIYEWTLQVEDVTGGWMDDPGGEVGTTMMDPAYEYNLNAAVDTASTPVVKAWRDSTGAVRFQGGTC